MAKGVVDLLETVEIDHGHGDTSAAVTRFLDLIGEIDAELVAIR